MTNPFITDAKKAARARGSNAGGSSSNYNQSASHALPVRHPIAMLAGGAQ